VDDQPDIEPVGLLAGESAEQPRGSVAHEAGQIARAPTQRHGLEHGRDAVGPKRDATFGKAILDVPQRQADAVGIADGGELAALGAAAPDIGRHRHARQLARDQRRLRRPHGADRHVCLSPRDVEADDGADQLDGDAGVARVHRVERG